MEKKKYKMKKIDELKQTLETDKGEASSENEDGKVEEAEMKLNEVRAINKQIEIQAELDKEEIREVETKMEKREIKVEGKEVAQNVEERNAFVKAIARKPLSEGEQ